MRTRLPNVWLLVLLFAAATSAAQTRPLPSAKGAWVLGFGAQADDESSDALLATVNWGVAPSTWLSFAAGRSSSPADRANVDADTLLVGVDHRFDNVGFTVELEQWGDADALETEDLAATVYFPRERWRIAFGYEARDIEIPFTIVGPLGRTIERKATVGAERYSLTARVALGSRWNLYLGAAEHDYERNLNLLPRIDSLNLLSASTLTLANSFLDDERSIGVERELGRMALNLRYATDHSAVDGSKLETFDVALLVPIGGRVDLEVNVGSGRSDYFDAGAYAGLLFLVYGR